jgi:hypothetical protein
MDFEAIDRAASRAVVEIRHPNGGLMWLADNEAETATDIPANAKRFNRLADAWDAADRNREAFRAAELEAVSVVTLWNRP